MTDDWTFDMPKDLGYKLLELLEWMVHNYCLDQFSCDWLMELANIELQEMKGDKRE